MEKLTKLPDAWALVGTKESRPILDKWLQKNHGYKGSYGGCWAMFLYPNWGNHKGFMDGRHTVGTAQLHYNGHKGEIISLEDFKRLAFPVKKSLEEELPEKWFVRPSEKSFEEVIKWARKKSGRTFSNYRWHGEVSFSENGDYRVEYDRTEITMEQFNKYILNKSSKLPEEYIVECNSAYESVKVHNTYYNCDNIATYWEYIVCRKDLIRSGGAKGNSIEHHIRPEYNEMPLFKFEEWNKLINNKEEKEMKEFRITGSAALQQAFINEVNIPYEDGENNNIEDDFSIYPVLGVDSSTTLTSFGDTGSNTKVFNLPTDWDAAVSYVKEWYKSKEEKIEDLFVPVKAGDLVMICKGEGNWGGYEMDKFVGKIVKVKTAESDESKIQIITFNLDDSHAWQWELKNKHYRKLTESELAEFKGSIKPLKLGEFTGIINTERKWVQIARRGDVPFSDCIKIYNSLKPILAGDYTVTSNATSINIGCVKDIPIKDIMEAVEYMDSMGLINL